MKEALLKIAEFFDVPVVYDRNTRVPIQKRYAAAIASGIRLAIEDYTTGEVRTGLLTTPLARYAYGEYTARRVIREAPARRAARRKLEARRGYSSYTS
jgi:hypothetical protein